MSARAVYPQQPQPHASCAGWDKTSSASRWASWLPSGRQQEHPQLQPEPPQPQSHPTPLFASIAAISCFELVVMASIIVSLPSCASSVFSRRRSSAKCAARSLSPSIWRCTSALRRSITARSARFADVQRWSKQAPARPRISSSGTSKRRSARTVCRRRTSWSPYSRYWLSLRSGEGRTPWRSYSRMACVVVPSRRASCPMRTDGA